MNGRMHIFYLKNSENFEGFAAKIAIENNERFFMYSICLVLADSSDPRAV